MADRRRPHAPGSRPAPARPAPRQISDEDSARFGKFQPKGVVRKSDLAAARRRRQVLALRVGAYVLGGVVLGAGLMYLLTPRTGCRANARTERALATVLAQKDARSGRTMEEELPGARFNCLETSQPAGVLVATVDSLAPATIWWVTDQGPHNVNLLSAAYTPHLPPAPDLGPGSLAEVSRPPEE